uniref:Putative 3' exoribonuclease n=1 Tax=Trypanosoma congolense (strain IL3000) TaxID=1068625 RepID=G0UQH4_TRYCI|nr:putative 3' exoribonuclease [Trypanosoma congolense IL3000]
MQFDEDIIPLMEKMDGALDAILKQLLPLLSSLDEDVLVSNYGVDEQARISLSAAFALLFLTFSHDRLLNKPGGAGEDQQLMLKINRVTEYIGKLREITLLDNKPQQLSKQQEQGRSSGTPAADNIRKRGRSTVGEHEGEKSNNFESKKARDSEDAGKTINSQECASSADPYGDAILFKEVERKPGKTSALVHNLLQHVKGPTIDLDV